MKLSITLLILSLSILSLSSSASECSENPIISYWYVSDATGYGDNDADCDWVKFDDDYSYVSSSGIPSQYTIGPWSNPNIAGDNDYIFRFPLSPEYETGTKTSLPLGAMAVLLNGVPLFSATSAYSYNDKEVWWVNALVTEVDTMDDCMGHPADTRYHHHSFPLCMFEDDDGSSHSPIYGFAFDGYPIYGPYGYSDPEDAESSVTRLQSGYSLRNISSRKTLADGTTLATADQGPSINDEYPLGYFLQDYEWLESNGDLDEYNGRFSVTPDYPDGIYAYFFTIDSNRDPEFPYIMNEGYKGVVYGSTLDNTDADVSSEAVEYDTKNCLAENGSVVISFISFITLSWFLLA